MLEEEKESFFIIFRIGRWKVYIFNYLKLERRKRKNWNQFGLLNIVKHLHLMNSNVYNE